MTFSELELLSLLFAGRNLSEAASRLGLSQPRASQLLGRLERELGCTLFVRSNTGLDPTEAGSAFRSYAQSMLDAWREGLEAATHACNGVHGPLHVGVSHTTSAFTVPYIVRQFHKVYPNVRVTLTRTLPPQLISGLEAGLFDLCLCFKPPRTAPLTWEALFESDLVGIYAPQFEKQISDRFADFARLPLILPSRACSTRLLVDSELQKAGVTANIVMEIDDSNSLSSMVKHGLAVSIVPRTMVRPSRQLLLTPLYQPHITAEAGLLMRKSPNSAAAAFAELIRQEIEAKKNLAVPKASGFHL